MRCFALPAVLLVSSLFASAAAPTMPLVNNSTINYSLSPNQITIIGIGFQPSTTAPTVLFNNVALAVVSFSGTQVVANLPVIIQPGS